VGAWVAPDSRLTIHGFTHSADGSALPAVEVCLTTGINAGTEPTEHLDCTLSGADGSFKVSGASSDDVLTLTFKKDGFVPTARPMAFQSGDITLPSNENVLLATPLVFMGKPTDPTKGQVSFVAITLGGGPAAEVSATLTGYDVPTGVVGLTRTPVYLDNEGAPAPEATAGSSGGFVDVAPGLYVAKFRAESGACVAYDLYGYPGALESDDTVAMLVPVIRGYLTAPIGVSCPDLSGLAATLVLP
jgi:hypothetical protein